MLSVVDSVVATNMPAKHSLIDCVHLQYTPCEVAEGSLATPVSRLSVVKSTEVDSLLMLGELHTRGHVGVAE